MSSVWGYKPIGLLDDKGNLIPFPSYPGDTVRTHLERTIMLDTAEVRGLNVAYISLAPKGCQATERHSHTGRHFECSNGCGSQHSCKRRAQ